MNERVAAEDVDTRWMAHAQALAKQAEARGEVPVGCVIVRDGALLAEGSNRPIATHDPTAHAEMVAMRAAARSLGTYRLTGSTLYVTLEPCPMCAGAMVHARIARLVYAAPDPRAGAAGTVFNLVDHPSLNHRIAVQGGVMSDVCGQHLRAFFVRRRRASKGYDGHAS
ncbi:MAG: tRNA adenosine(34) deaminase TadA [Pseudomonadota bacterium]